MESGNRYIRNNFERPSSVVRLYAIVSLPRHLSYLPLAFIWNIPCTFSLDLDLCLRLQIQIHTAYCILARDISTAKDSTLHNRCGMCVGLPAPMALPI
jgi:hypothetical protein